MEITSLTENDLLQLMALQAELLDETGDLDRMRELFTLILKDQNYHLLGAKKDGQLIGSLVGIVCHDLIGKCLPFMVVENVIVTKTFRRQGVGRMLMTAIEKVARARACRYIMLVSAITREQAPAFYQGLGYESDPYRGYKMTLMPNQNFQKEPIVPE